MALRLVAESAITSPADLEAAGPVEATLPEGSQVQFEVGFSYRFPGFGTAASSLNAILRDQGVSPWSRDTPLVEADPTRPLWRIRYTKGVAWLGLVIIGAILALVVIALLVLWRLLLRVAEGLLPGLVFMALGTAGFTAGLYLFRRRPPR